ncbi:hypothetical protein JW879_08155 [candidate division WOR-3 bacterium]|nr:hypothetical protein [candidate division WOR-3 bacterium]
MAKNIRQFFIVFILFFLIFILGCTTIPCSNLESPVIEEGVSFGMGVETLNQEFNDFVKDSLGSSLEIVKSSALIFKFSQGWETFVTVPTPRRVNWEFSFSTHCLYPHPTIDEVLFEGNENDNSAAESIYQDIVWNMRFHTKVSYENVAFSASYIPFAAGFTFSPIFSLPLRNKTFIPYMVPSFSYSDLLSKRLSLSLGFSFRPADHLEILGEGTYVHSSLYDSVSKSSDFPVLAIFIKYLSN